MKNLTISLALACWVGGALGNLAAQAQNTANEAVQTSQANVAKSAEHQPSNAADLDLDQLANMDVKVTSASKKEESLSGAAAAIYVISSEDIRRSGLSSIPELLRMVPGMTVQHVNSHSWTVSARGYNQFPNEKMLVMIDGRSVYDPLYGGINWDEQEMPLDDIERIEVIRGPGGTLWGANAINGVINIITRSAQETPGLRLSTSSGHDEGYQGSVRYGGRIGEHLFYRVYEQSSYWDAFVDPSGNEMLNDWNLSQGGFRIDWKPSPKDTLTVEGRGYQGHIRDTAYIVSITGSIPDPYAVKGGDISGNWAHTFSARSSTKLSAYCDWSDRTDIQFAGEFLNTCGFGLQHDYTFSPRHSLIWGGDFRSTADNTRVTIYNHFIPPDRRLNFYSAFAQYEVAVVPDRLRIVGGSKFEHNPFTGFEIQPQIRAVWTPSKAHNIWASVSRAVRTPTRNEHDHFMLENTIAEGTPNSLPIYMASVGNPLVQSEHLMAYELGYRYQPAQNFSIDLAAFYNSYTNLILPNFTHGVLYLDPAFPALILPMPFENMLKTQTHGLEASARWRPVHFWGLTMGVTEDRGTGFSMMTTPRHQFTVQSRINLPKNLEFDSTLYHSNGIRSVAYAGNMVDLPTSNRLDVGLSWRQVHGLTVGIWGRNLQSDRYRDGFNVYSSLLETRRAIVVKVTWDFNPEKTVPKQP